VQAGFVCLAVILGLVQASPASAEFFQFSTTTTLGAIVPAPTSVSNNGTPLVSVLTAGGTPISFEGLNTVGPENLDASGIGTDIVFSIIDVSVINASPLEAINIPFDIKVAVTDYTGDTTASAITGSAIFSVTGTLSGTIGAGRKVNLNSVSFNPIASQVIGTDLYSFVINTFVPPGPFFPGAIGAHVTANPVPEPGTMALLGVGAVGLVLPAIRRWRKRATR
jgi:hypothetical protein